MKHLHIMIAISFALTISCCKKPVEINRDYLIGHWVSEEDNYNNVHSLLVEDSILAESITGAVNSVIPYYISYDTLIFSYSENNDYICGTSDRDKKVIIFKFKIIRLDSLKLTIKQIFPKERDTIFFNKIIQEKKNDLKIDRLEFYSGPCFGECPVQRLRIDFDSTLYFFGDGSFTKHKGLYKHKLNSVEFSRIQSRLNSIDRKHFKFCLSPPDSPYFKLFIRTQNDSIETDGDFCYHRPTILEIYSKYSDNEYSDFNEFVSYLWILERFLNLEQINEQEIDFKYK